MNERTDERLIQSRDRAVSSSRPCRVLGSLPGYRTYSSAPAYERDAAFESANENRPDDTGAEVGEILEEVPGVNSNLPIQLTRSAPIHAYRISSSVPELPEVPAAGC